MSRFKSFSLRGYCKREFFRTNYNVKNPGGISAEAELFFQAPAFLVNRRLKKRKKE